ncbi:Efflux ABC transporter, ATP-binding protein [hydrothermal vent metagenome]|uniref:Efflux ABC transporter, ATP-binding protein n=1 Tax=hydrothermal vent metagenome TaxID=652676 RepID=A0A3B0S2V4_9ZZZZ
MVAEGSPRSLIEEHTPRDVVELRFPVGILETIGDDVAALSDRTEILADRALVYTDDADKMIGVIAESVLEPETVLARRSTLEDVFLRLTGRTLVD